MNNAQRDLLAACWNKHMKADYPTIHTYAAKYHKYDYLTIREIGEVVAKLEALYKDEAASIA